MDNYFFSLTSIVCLLPILVEFFKSVFRIKDRVAFKLFGRSIMFVQILTQVLSITIAAVCQVFNIGYFSGLSIYISLFWGVMIGLCANGLFDAGYLNVLEAIYNSIKYSKTKQKHG